MSRLTFWLLVGFLGQALFTARFAVQWLVSERKRESVVPVSFWWLSLLGGGALLAYAISRQDPVIIVGQAMGLFVLRPEPHAGGSGKASYSSACYGHRPQCADDGSSLTRRAASKPASHYPGKEVGPWIGLIQSRGVPWITLGRSSPGPPGRLPWCVSRRVRPVTSRRAISWPRLAGKKH